MSELKSDRTVLRSPGLSGAINALQELRGPFAVWCSAMMLLGMLLGVAMSAMSPPTVIHFALPLVGMLATGVVGVLVWRRAERAVAKRGQGIRGELLVATQLADLGSRGFIVMHDLPCANMNIDHVLVGPTGIYAVETKMWTKHKGREHKVTFDGTAILFADGRRDEHPIRQVQAAMAHLRRELQDDSIPVRGIVVIPEWFVAENSGGDIAVLNDQRVYSYLQMHAPILNGDRVRRTYWLLARGFHREIRTQLAEDRPF